MPRRDASASLPKQDLLKIDKDCVVNAGLQREYVGTVLDICANHAIKVLWIKRTDTAHGIHYYIKIAPAIGAHSANRLQYLLGDDPKRVAFNKARIESGLVGWNKLFERAGARLRTIYETTQASLISSELFNGTHTGPHSQKIVSLCCRQVRRIGLNKSTFHYLRKRARDQRPFKIYEPVLSKLRD